MSDQTGMTDEELNAAIRAGVADAHAAVEPYPPINDDTWIGPWPDREWLIPGWLPVGRLGMLSGRGGRGKSRLALQLVARMAASPAAHGPFVPAARGPGNDTAVSDANLALDSLVARIGMKTKFPLSPSSSVRRCVRTQAVRAQSLCSGLFGRVGSP